MSYCKTDGKDKIIFVTKEDHETPSTVTLPEDDGETRGFLLPNGEINWNCPCLGDMVVGPCSVEFRESISCFYYSKAEPKGSDCMEQFRDMNACMARYPTLYKRDDDEEEDDSTELSSKELVSGIEPEVEETKVLSMPHATVKADEGSEKDESYKKS